MSSFFNCLRFSIIVAFFFADDPENEIDLRNENFVW